MLMVDKQISPAGACLMIVATAAFIGFVNGFLITRVKLQPFIVTLCGLLFYRGLARFIVKDETRGFAEAQNVEWLRNLTIGNWLGVPIPFVVLLTIAAILFVVLHRSVWGRYLFAVGRNEEAARYAGIRSDRVIAGAYVICGVLAGIATIQIAFYTNSISPSSHGNFYELYAIAAAVLGGCSLRGGEGSILGVLLGTTLLQVLRNLVNLLGIPSSLDFAVMGAVILIGVLADQLLRQRKRTA
jgi:ribose transport system permease protein